MGDIIQPRTINSTRSVANYAMQIAVSCVFRLLTIIRVLYYAETLQQEVVFILTIKFDITNYLAAIIITTLLENVIVPVCISYTCVFHFPLDFVRNPICS